jgi:hypothetical protein
MGTLATFTFRVACLCAVGACESSPPVCVTALTQLFAVKTLPVTYLTRTARVKLELEASPSAVNLVADVQWEPKEALLVGIANEGIL